MPTAFSTALSGLSAHATAIDVVGNNLANLNTTGYKSNTVSFRDLVAQGLAGGSSVGLGVAPAKVVRHFTQGGIQSSSGPFDAAIQGDGLFILRNPQNAILYTRAGNFQIDGVGNLITGTRERVQGWTEKNGVLDTSGPTSDIALAVGAVQPPSATSGFSIDANLNAAAPAGDTFSVPLQIFDSLGVSHVITITLTHATAANAWDYKVTVPGADVGSANPTVAVLTSTSPLTFNAQGQLTAPTANLTGIAVTGLTSGAADLNLRWDLFSGTLPRITQFAQPSAVAANAQDGSPPAQLVKVALADEGKVVAQFSNGNQRVVAQLALASVRNPESLLAVGNNSFLLGADSALPAVGVSETGGRGKVIGNALESSTVDIAQEFTNLIILQRGYQANGKVITTADELSQETINLKR
jgi:flagellar hook protein FlgE